MKLRGGEALAKLLADYKFKTVLDLGCGSGNHTRVFRERRKRVTSLDVSGHLDFAPDRIGPFEDTVFPEPFDCIWCCHVLEHIRNPGFFLDKVFHDLKVGGILAVTVPPLKHQIVSGHLTLWNAGLLIYNLIVAGFDCRKASVKTYGYNISVIVAKVPTGVQGGARKLGELSQFFPVPFSNNTDGRIERANW